MSRRRTMAVCIALLGIALAAGLRVDAQATAKTPADRPTEIGPTAIGPTEIAIEALRSSARISFDWGEAVDYQVWSLQGFVFVRFSRPVTADIDEISRRLGAYFPEVRLMTGGRLLSLRTAPGVRVGHSTVGTAVILSVTRPPAGAAGKAEAEDGKGRATPERRPRATPPAPEPVVVGFVRSGEHDRLSFRWRERVDYTFGRTDSTAILVFKRAGNINRQAIARQLAAAGIEIEIRPLGNGTAVRLHFARPVRLRDGRDGDAVFVDILPAAGEAVAGDREKPEPPKPHAGERKDDRVEERTEERMGDPPEEPGAGGNGDEDVVVRVERTEDGPRLAVRWPELVPAAVFRHAGDIWVVFGATHDFAGAGLGEALAPEVALIRKIVLDDATVLRLRTARPMWPVVEREGWEWRVTLAAAPRERSRASMHVGRTFGVDGRGRVDVRVGVVGSVVSLPVETLGTTLAVVPLKAPGLGIEATRRFPQFRILESVQGLAIEPVADGVTVRIEDNEAVVSAPGGLVLSGRGGATP